MHEVDAERIVRLVRAVAAVDGSANRDEVIRAVADLAAVTRWCDGREVALAGYMAKHSPLPEKPIAKAGRSTKKAKRALKRNETKKETPKLGEALEQGRVSGEHLDVAAGALAGVEADKRKELAARIDAHAGDAEEMSAEEFARMIRAEQQRMDDDEGESRLERQQRAIRFNHRVDPATGMIEFWGKLDPLRGMKLLNQVKERVAKLFAEKVPEGCPSDPLEKNGYLRALALLDLCEGHGARGGRPEVIVVVDTRGAEGNGDGPHVDWGLPVELPVSVLTNLFGQADVRSVVVRNGAILHAPGRLNLGRTTRLANVAQRRALRAIYPRCAIPDCPVWFDHCKVHHVKWWRHGGRTDLENLLPVCVRHHTSIHDEGWVIELAPDRVLTLTLPNGEVMATGPPRRRAA